MSDMYRDHLLDHAKRPRNYGALPAPVIIRHAANPSCGDILDIYVVLRDGYIEQATFTGRGCVISQASASIVLESVHKKSVKMVLAMRPEDVVGLLGVEPGPMRMNCALLVLGALQGALKGLPEYA